ncbi:MAG: DUF11 domain-containing protein [Beutenbergiaceae bacterium]
MAALLPMTSAQAAPVIGASLTALNPTVGAGDPATFEVDWQCSGVRDNCENMRLVVSIPTGQPDGTLVLVDSVAASSGGETAAPVVDVAAGTITWIFNSPIVAGANGQIIFSLVPENFRTPDGQTITPVATLSADDVDDVVTQATTTVTASTDLDVVKVLANPTLTPALDQPVTYYVNAGSAGTFGPNGQATFSCGAGSPGLNLMNVQMVDQLPVGAVFEAASNGGVYDAATHTVTWPAVDELGSTLPDGTDSCGSWRMPYSITLRYPSTHFSATDTVTNSVAATAHSYLRPDDTYSESASVSHTFDPNLVGAGQISKLATFPGPRHFRGQNYTGQGGTYYELRYSNTGNVVLDIEATDVLPCTFTSPTDPADTGCAAPALLNVFLGFRNGQLGDTVDLTYTTNLGNTATITISYGDPLQTPITSTTEWITKVVVDGVVVPGSSGSILIGGQIHPDLPQAVPDSTPYEHPGVYTGPTSSEQNLWIENCVESMTLSYGANAVAVITDTSDVFTRCGYLQVMYDSVNMGPTKRIENSVQPIGGEMEVFLGVRARFGSAPLLPILSDLLPADLRYVEGQTPQQINLWGGSPWDRSYLDASLLNVEVIDDYQGTGRQLVRFTWPGAEPMPVNGAPVEVGFAVEVQPEAPVGTRTNSMLVFDDLHPQWPATTDNCFGGRYVDEFDQSGNGDVTDLGCRAAAPYTVTATGGLNATKWVRGSADPDFTAFPGVGLVVPGETASFRVDVRNTGNVDLENVISYDILPHPGDTGVGPASGQARDSGWQTLLFSPVTVPGVLGAEVSYSTSVNPCRGEVFSAGGATADGPAGCVNDWTSTPPSDLALVRAIRVDYGSHVFEPGDVVPFEFDVRAPQVADGTAWNSVALAGQRADTGNWLLPVEPRIVGLSTAATLVLSKTAAVECAAPGTDVTFTIGAANNGPGTATDIVLSDVVPTPLEFVGATGDGDYDPATGTWALHSLDGRQSASLTVTATIPESAVAGDSYTNEVSFVSAYGVTGDDPVGASVTVQVCDPPPPVVPTPPTTSLTVTGADVSPWLLVAVLGMVTVGAALVVVRRRRA